MIDWQTLRLEQTWPIWLVLPVAILLCGIWFLRQQDRFPDLSLVLATRRSAGLADRWLPVSGVALLAALLLVMARPSVVFLESSELLARDFVILVDTSRSMRHDTAARRGDYELNFRRRVGAFAETVDDPDKMPLVARFELARESLFRFLANRRPGDRAALIYFNDNAQPMSALTNDIGFVTEQLATMDDYVNWGTDIADALDSSLNVLDRYPGDNRRTLILLTDAETRYTRDLEQQLTRIAGTGLAFYLLWITTDTGDLSTEDANRFLDLARSVGTVVTIRNPDPENMQAAFADISRREGYSYAETRRRTIDLAAPLLDITRIALLAWLLCAATLFHPALGRKTFRIGIR